jgi:nicotinamidase/pyrazinamidase
MTNEPTRALLVIDMANDFIDPRGSLYCGSQVDRIVPSITLLCDQFVSENQLVVFVTDCHEYDSPHFQQWPRHCVAGTWGARLVPALEGRHLRPRSWYIPKPGYDAFYNTCLDGILRERFPSVRELHLTGVCTDICVFATAMSAYHRGYATAVYDDACAGFSDEQHALFLRHMARCFKTRLVGPNFHVDGDS